MRATSGTHPVSFYIPRHSYLFDTGFAEVGNGWAVPGNTLLFQSEEETWAALWIDNRYFISAANVLPSGTQVNVGSGGHLELEKGYWAPGQRWETNVNYKETTQTIEGSRPVIFDTHWYVHLLRRPDSKLYYRFEVLLEPRP